MSWLEVSLELTGELAEPVAELLARYADGGVAIEQTPVSQDNPDGALSVIVRAYLPKNELLQERRRAIEQGLWHLGQISKLPVPSYQDIEQQDWNESWRKGYHPIPIGESLMILPAWVEPPQNDRHMIIIEPGMAFGTGAHPTTRMSLLALEDYCRDGDRVIDLGCGSGILSIAAIHCGAREVLALDIDAQAIASAHQNLILNGIEARVQLLQGSLDEAAQQAMPEGASLVVANILAPILIELLEEGLSKLVLRGGTLILAGILEDQLAAVLQSAAMKGLRPLATYTEADWRAVALTKD